MREVCIFIFYFKILVHSLPLLSLKIQLSILLVEVSTFLHACEGDAVTKLTNAKIPYFNAPIYLQNKTQIGKVDEIFGPINESVSTQRSPSFSFSCCDQ